MTLHVIVIGTPQPAGSKRAFAHPSTGRIVVTDDAKGSRPWKQEVAQTVLAHTHGVLFTGPVKMVLDFYLTRPKGHHGTGRNAGAVRAGAPAFPAVKPDLTKLTRAVEDALIGTALQDDARVVEQTVRKLYGAPERVEIHLTPLLATVGVAA